MSINKSSEVLLKIFPRLLEEPLFKVDAEEIGVKNGFTLACTRFALESAKRAGFIWDSGYRYMITAEGKKEMRNGFPTILLPPDGSQRDFWKSYWP